MHRSIVIFGSTIMDQLGFTELAMASPDYGRRRARDELMVKFISRITTTQEYMSYFNNISK